METGIVQIAFVPVRREPSEQSEQVTQLLFGELCEIMENKGNWYNIRAEYDHYQGWCDRKMILPLDDSVYTKLIQSDPLILPDPFLSVTRTDTGSKGIIPAGSAAWQFMRKENSFVNGETTFRFDRQPSDIETASMSSGIEKMTAGFLNTPYLWGGKSTFGCDCSGFVQTVYKIFGQALPRDAAEQVNSGETIPFIHDADPGDLAFFDNEEGEIIHVGIVLNENRIIHASGKVRIDAFDQEGIYNYELGRYTHKLRIIKRIKGHGI